MVTPDVGSSVSHIIQSRMVLIYVLASVALILTSLYYYLTWNYNFWQKQGIPCAKNIIPGLGNVAPAFFLRRSVGKICEDFFKNNENHSMFGFYLMTQPALLLRDPELVKSVLMTQFANFQDNQVDIRHSKEDVLLSINPFFSNTETWKDNRAPLSNAFSSKKLKSLVPLIQDANTKMEDYLKKKVNLHNGEYELELKEFSNLYTGQVGSTGIGIQGHNFKEDDKSTENEWTMKKVIETMFEGPSFTGGFTQFIIWYCPWLAKIFKSYMTPKEMDLFFRHTVKSILEHRKRENIIGNDFLQAVLDYIRANGSRLDEETAVSSYMLSFSIETYETSAITLGYLAFQLACHPEIQEKLREEVKRVYKKYNGSVDYEALKEMTYLDQALNESMRLNHVLGTMIKVCTKETQLVGSDGISCKIKPGNLAVIVPMSLQMDPKYWPDPEKFDPDRFSDEQKAGRPKCCFIPFGEGPRICVGMRMAIIVIKLGIVTILKDYSIEVSPKTPLPLRKDDSSFLTAYEKGLWVILKPLKQNAS